MALRLGMHAVVVSAWFSRSWSKLAGALKRLISFRGCPALSVPCVVVRARVLLTDAQVQQFIAEGFIILQPDWPTDFNKKVAETNLCSF